MQNGTHRVQIEELKPALDRLYESFNYPDSATDPIQIVRRWKTPEDREIVGLCAAALAFGRVSSVLQSIERVLGMMDGEPAATSAASIPAVTAPRSPIVVHRWTRGPDLVALLWIMRQMIDRAGSIEDFFLEGYDPAAEDVEGALDSFSTRALALDLRAAYGKVPKRPGVCYFFPAPVRGQRLQADESVPAVDGPPGRARSGRVDPGVAGQARRAARHARHPRRPLPASDAPRQPWMADGARHHRLAAAARRRRSGEVRLRAVPPRHDERVRVQSRGVDVSGGLPPSLPPDSQCPLRGLCRPRGRTRRPSRRPSARR